MAYILLACIAIASLAVYLLVVFREVPGAVAERLGELEGLPENLGQWTVDATSEAARTATDRGLQREQRTWREPGSGWFGRDRLLLQVRYRNLQTGEIESADPDRKLTRKRVKK
ncbi:MAG TPA: hypothetical protein VJU61_28830 [Polyangiaceae bacterium]|nr:hypothetical protein [Polyangiaceae bacterium]